MRFENEREFRRLILKVFAERSGSVTLASSATTTTLADPAISPTSKLFLTPTTANAASALASTYVSSKSNGQATLGHASNGQLDRTFDYLVIG